MDAGVLPVKRLRAAKTRLSSRFTPEERLEIAAALLEDSLDLCLSARFLTWWVVSDDDGVLDAARARGLNVARDPGGGLNAALAHTARLAVAAGAASITVIPADVPLARAVDVRDVVDTGATSDVVVVPSERDGGTNALYMSPGDLIEPRFGRGSLAAHVLDADRLGHRCSILSVPRLALDIDAGGDVDTLLQRDAGGSRTAEVLARLTNRAGTG